MERCLRGGQRSVSFWRAWLRHGAAETEIISAMERRLIRGAPVILAIVAFGGCGNAHHASAGTASASASHADGLEQQRRMVHVIQTVGAEVVQIETPSGLGSGVVFDAKGDIVTNAHVVGSATRLRVTTSDGIRHDATLVGRFAADDLAVVKVSGSRLAPATFKSTSKLDVGDVTLAIGNPLGLQSSVTNGIVSALGRTVTEPGGSTLPNVIQTSASINPGNSGGALVDLSGAVIGIPTLAAVDPELGGSAAPGIGFAIPSDIVTDIAGQIVAHGHVVNSHRAYLGIQLATGMQTANAVVAAVSAGGPAARAGLKPGDTILTIAGHATPSSSDVAIALAQLTADKKVPVRVRRADATTTTVDVTLGEYPTHA